MKSREMARYSRLGDYIESYPSARQAAESVGVTPMAVLRAAATGGLCAGSLWRRAEDDGVYPRSVRVLSDNGERRGHPGRKVARYNLYGQYDREFRSVGDAAKESGVRPASLCQALKRGGLCGGWVWRYADDAADATESIDYELERRGRKAAGGYVVYTPGSMLASVQRKEYLKENAPYFVGLFESLEQISAVMEWPMDKVRRAERSFAEGGYLLDDGPLGTGWRLCVMRLETEEEAECYIKEHGGERNGELYRVTEWPGREDG